MQTKLKRPRPLRPIIFAKLIPNAITILALCAGLTSIRFCLEARYEVAVIMIFIAAFLDLLDGLVARVLRAQTKMGGQLDSLADFLNFGVAPIILIYVWASSSMGQIGWMAMLFYCVCSALRLARFHLHIEDDNRPSWENAFFIGVPMPAAAILLLLPLYFHFLAFDSLYLSFLIVLYSFGVGILMIAPLPTYSLKKISFRIQRPTAAPILLLVALLGSAFFNFSWASAIFACGVYLGSLPFSAYSYKRQREMSL